MARKQEITRRGFIGGTAVALASAGIVPGAGISGIRDWRVRGDSVDDALIIEADDYDDLIKLNYNENPYGPSQPVLAAMTDAFKYSNRYGYPDRGVKAAIAEHHGVKPENILLGAGSGEILEVVGLSLLGAGKKVVGSDPSYGAVYSHASGIHAESITVPLLPDYQQDIPALIEATRRHYREVGFVYLCNPNNPTGRPVPSADVQALLDGIPDDVPVLIDEAYHHFVDDPAYTSSIPHVLEGRRVIVARTFSKLYGLAAMRLGFGVATPEMIKTMQPYATGSVNALAKWGAVAALQDTDGQRRVRDETIRLRRKTSKELAALGYEVIPSETNFIMVHTGRPAREVRAAFRERGIVVGRPFPPLLEHLRVSIGSEAEMAAFMDAFRDIFRK